jgi:acetamidase/formamidase
MNRMATHQFKPTRYQTTLGPHEPVLRIAPGDTVGTTTVDAAGCDASGKQVTSPGNPQTGPFFIDGAEAGDALVVRFESIRCNRDTGWSSTTIAPNVIEPWHVRELPAYERGQWRIDRNAGTTTILQPKTSLGDLTIPIAPMLGCFGVAPDDHQAISTATSGPHGGNMDYRGFREGVTVYFPVFAPGALLFMGDGHAVQGDGEIVGTGVETSLDVTFTVDLIKGARLHWPRGQDQQSIFTVGNARPLDQAVQHATSEMVRWLMSDYGLDARGACILLGQCVQYDVGNVFDPAYTMVCKVPKALLDHFGGEKRK